MNGLLAHTERTLCAVDISESSTLTANAVPHANGWVRYSSAIWIIIIIILIQKLDIAVIHQL